ncbi:hypothetical protein [Ancrocorticia populi]|uniref:hypothetical protein n=1 Tax=Ancrocorticia populi TaxID=2175228 RepID=UPI0023523947|nr:hypothetical protein [Ancrocorticia populi]
MTAIADTTVRTPSLARTATAESKGSLRLGVVLGLITLFFLVAFAGAIAEASGVVIASGVMTAVLVLALVVGTVKDAIESPAA